MTNAQKVVVHTRIQYAAVDLNQIIERKVSFLFQLSVQRIYLGEERGILLAIVILATEYFFDITIIEAEQMTCVVGCVIRSTASRSP